MEMFVCSQTLFPTFPLMPSHIVNFSYKGAIFRFSYKIPFWHYMQCDYKWAIWLSSLVVAVLTSEQYRESWTGRNLPQYRSWYVEFGCSAFTTVTTPSILLHITGRSATTTGQQSILSTLSSSLRLWQGGRPSALPMVHYPAWINEKSRVWPPFYLAWRRWKALLKLPFCVDGYSDFLNPIFLFKDSHFSLFWERKKEFLDK